MENIVYIHCDKLLFLQNLLGGRAAFASVIIPFAERLYSVVLLLLQYTLQIAETVSKTLYVKYVA